MMNCPIKGKSDDRLTLFPCDHFEGFHNSGLWLVFQVGVLAFSIFSNDSNVYGGMSCIDTGNGSCMYDIGVDIQLFPDRQIKASMSALPRSEEGA